MQNLSLGEGAFINVRNVVLPKARFVVFQPQLSTFNDISNPKAVLEMELRKHTALTNGDTLVIKYLGTNHALKVLDLKPAVRLLLLSHVHAKQLVLNTVVYVCRMLVPS
jgi:ubiquitin fusion degradation protein 1